MNDLPSAHNWLDAGVIEIAVLKCTFDMAGDLLDLISKKMDFRQFSPPFPPPVLFLRIFFGLLLWNVSSYSKVKKKFDVSLEYCLQLRGTVSLKCNKAEKCILHELEDRLQGEKDILHTIKGRKANWIGHILCTNCLQNTY